MSFRYLWLLQSFVICSAVPLWSRKFGLYHYGYSLVIRRSPSYVYGGQPFDVQPQIVVHYEDLVNATFQGYVYAELEDSPTDLEVLQVENSTHHGSTPPQAIVRDGVAIFESLYLNEAGTYILRYTLASAAHEDLAWVLSDPFIVSVGQPWCLGLKQYPTGATAGEPLLPQPIIAVLDQGGNIVSSLNSGFVSAASRDLLLTNSSRNDLQPATSSTVPIVNGFGTFNNLKINREGLAYFLVFNCSLVSQDVVCTDKGHLSSSLISTQPLGGQAEISSLPFAVTHGTYASIALMQPISTFPVIAGKPFKLQPEIQVRDQGGNLLVTDTSSRILIEADSSLVNAPPVLPKAMTFAPILNGSVNFTQLYVSLPFIQFRLLFRLYTYDRHVETFSRTEIKVYSDYFNVLPSGITGLFLDPAFSISEKWAGGAPFPVPPVLELLDTSGAVLADDRSYSVQVTMTRSPGYSRNIGIDATQNGTAVYAQLVSIDHIGGSYGVGEEMLITVEFSDDVLLNTLDGTPYLMLNVTSQFEASCPPSNTSESGVTGPYGRLLSQYSKACCITPPGRHAQLRFQYTVVSGDHADLLDLFRNESGYDNSVLYLNGASLADLNAQPVNCSLNVVESSHSISRLGISIDTSQPYAGAAWTNLPTGSYGVGQIFSIFLQFTKPVSVKGRPLVPLATNANASVSPGYAQYTNGSGTDTLIFGYTVQPGDEISTLNVRSDLSIILDTEYFSTYLNESICVNRTDHYIQISPPLPPAWLSQNSSAYRNCSYQQYVIDRTYPKSRILTASSNPSQLVDLRLGQLWQNVSDLSQISLTSIPPRIDPSVGVYTNAPNGQYHAGDQILIYVKFTQEVNVQPSVRLGLRSLLGGPTADYYSGNGTALLVFVYSIEPYDYSPHLDIVLGQAFMFAQGGYIRRKATVPSTDADFSMMGLIPAGTTLANQSHIDVYALPPYVTKLVIGMESSPDNTVYGLDAKIFLNVTFSDDVSLAQKQPALILSLAGQSREAMYLSGNLSRVLVFVYTVQYGDYTPQLSLRRIPDAICVASGCPQPSSSAYIRQRSSNPIANADLSINGLGLSLDGQTGFFIVGNVSIDATHPTRQTSIVSVDTKNPSGIYGVGELIEFLVTLSDVVRVSGELPSLFTTVRRPAIFSSGENSRRLHFFLLIEEDFSSGHLDVAFWNNTTSAFICAFPICTLTNVLGAVVNLSMTHVPPLPKNITIDQERPRVTSVFTLKNSSCYDDVYTIGEEIVIHILVNLPVTVVDVPRLKMAVGPQLGHYALYMHRGSTSRHLLFSYTVQAGDVTADLTYQDTHALEVNTIDTGLILRDATIPTQSANVSLPPPGPLNLYGQAIRIDSINVPYVCNITSANVSGTYAPGDSLFVNIHFSKTVVVSGFPRLYLDLTSAIRDAVYVQGSGSHILSFQYIVQPGDSSAALDYVDLHALQMTEDKHEGPSSIRQISMSPTVNARIDLPFPGDSNSLSFNSKLRIDGAVPFITSIDYLQADGLYGLGGEITVLVSFSAPVFVQGLPSLLLETGLVDREAVYVNGSGGGVLRFLYRVQRADKTGSLDYWSESSRMRSAASSLRPNGGYIRRASMHPTLNADLHLNPPYASLRGSQTISSMGGIATFPDLWIDRRGGYYKLRFTANVTLGGAWAAALATVAVEESAEFQLWADTPMKGEKFGYAVDIRRDQMLVGAPASRKRVLEIQTVRTEGGVRDSDIIDEIQVFGTQIPNLPEIQTFQTSASPYKKVGGTFHLAVNGRPSRAIEAAVGSAALQVYLSEDFPELGTVKVARENNVYCACSNAYRWTLTFISIRGRLPVVQTMGAGLDGQGVHITPITILQQSPVLGGGFTLALDGHKSRQVPFDAADSDLLAALTQDLNLTVLSLSGQGEDPYVGWTWYVRFAAYNQDYDIPQISIDPTTLTGEGANAWSHVAVNGQGPITGSFALSFRKSPWTTPLPYNATAFQVQEALEALPTIIQVDVRREGPDDRQGYVWVVTFYQVRIWSSYGYILDQDMGNLEALQCRSFLHGTNSKVWVASQPESGSYATNTSPERAGSVGPDAGHVYAFSQHKDRWTQVQDLSASDTNQFDRFGSAVSLSNDGTRAAIGAPGSDAQPLQKHAFYCNANGGSFQLTWGNISSGHIPYWLNRSSFARILYHLRESHVLFPTIRIVGWNVDQDGDGICRDRNMTLLVDSPVYENLDDSNQLFETSRLSFNKSLLNGRLITQWTNPDADTVLLAGAVYVFDRALDGTWLEAAKLTPADGQPNDEIGLSVKQQGNYTMIGAPGKDGGEGAVYIFHYEPQQGLWSEMQKLDTAFWGRVTRQSFGDQIEMGDNWIGVGAPGYMNASGAVYIFAYDRGTYIPFQQILPIDPQRGGQFGCSLAAQGKRIIIGACGLTTYALHSARHMDIPVRTASVGAVYIYEFSMQTQEFEYSSRLIGSNLKAYDRFGWRVSLQRDTLLAAAFTKTESLLRSGAAVQAITVTAVSEGQPVGSTFEVSWMTEEASGLWHSRRSRPLQSNTTAEDLAMALEQDLMTGKLSVSRSKMDPRTDGFTWAITFLERLDPINTLQASSTGLSGNMPRAFVTVLNDPPRKTRGMVHAFRYHAATKQWREQSFLYPTSKQHQDLFASSLALDESGSRAIVGMPNRDTQIPGNNAGAVMLFSLDLLTVSFDRQHYTVSERDPTVTVGLHRSSGDAGSIPFKLMSLDSNADERVQTFLKDIYDIGDVPADMTISDLIGAGTALARAQYHGSREKRSLWLGGMYDYRAISDYLPTASGLYMGERQTSVTSNIGINNDHILEKPDETFAVIGSQKGMLASTLGDLWSVVTIEDDGDGMVFPPLHTTFSKLSGNSTQASQQLGSSLAMHEQTGIAIIGAATAPGIARSGLSKVGKAYVFQRTRAGWLQLAEWRPVGARVNSRFGESVALSPCSLSRDSTELVVAVGAPGEARVYVYLSYNNTKAWKLDTILSVPGAPLSQHGFGALNALSVSGDVLAVGAEGLEYIYAYERKWNFSDVASTGIYSVGSIASVRQAKLNLRRWAWSRPTRLTGSGYDYDMLRGKKATHRRHFGASCSLSQRTLVAGAPEGYYSQKGTPYIDLHDTDGEWHSGLASGEVHVFYRAPEIWHIEHWIDLTCYEGSWYIHVRQHELTCRTDSIDLAAMAADIKAALEACPNIGTVDVTQNSSSNKPSPESEGVAGHAWTITFVSAFTAISGLVPSFFYTNVSQFVTLQPINATKATNATYLIGTHDSNTSRLHQASSHLYAARQLQNVGDWQEQTVLRASDHMQGDQFGYALALDNEQLIISALSSGAVDYTTWDFETGDLQGWSKTGDAFDFQPTYGDNSFYRASAYVAKALLDSGQSQRTGLQGRYFIGTYEKRPGNGSAHCMEASTIQLPGSAQGDAPMGTLTSQPFTIMGDSISFLVGGGCDPMTVYVELLVDGFSVARATGQCREAMYRNVWNASLFINRTGQIRIVDAASVPWAHINVDDIRFSWSEQGAGKFAGSQGTVTYPGPMATPQAGVAYAFLRRDPDTDMPCIGNRSACVWVEQARLEASDRRPRQQFAYSVSLDDKEGVAVIGAVNTEAAGIWKEALPGGPSDANQTCVALPLKDIYDESMTSPCTFTSLPTGARGVWEEELSTMESTGGTDLGDAGQTGAVYVYSRSRPVYGPSGEVLQAPRWTPREQFRLQSSDGRAGDQLGCSVHISGSTLLVGAAGQDAFARDAGAAYVYDVQIRHMYLTRAEYVGLEGTDAFIEIRLARDVQFADKALSVAYATSDLTARAVDYQRFAECMALPVSDRINCGDYVQTNGIVTFPVGASRASFRVYIVNDDCKGLDSRYAQLTLSIPGAAALLGEQYMAKVRIDEDDLGEMKC